MDRHPIVLGFVLREFPDFEFGVHSFNDRLHLQKFIYMLQAHDVYLGYDFSWYLRGPYCTTLATAGFALDDFYDDIPKKLSKDSQFASQTIRLRFARFKKFIRGRENDIKFLEAAASLHFLLKTHKATGDDEAVKKVAKKMPKTDEPYVGDVLADLKKEGLL